MSPGSDDESIISYNYVVYIVASELQGPTFYLRGNQTQWGPHDNIYKWPAAGRKRKNKTFELLSNLYIICGRCLCFKT